MRPIQELTDILTHLPGLGPRQARRVVQYLLSKDQNFRNTLSNLIGTMSTKTAQCTLCLRYDDANDGGLCVTCADESRDHTTLVVVEHDVDIDALEASLTYKGLYFVLGGLMPLARQKKAGKEIREAQLMNRIQKADGLKEVIFALSTTPEGDYTARELMSKIHTKIPNIETTLLGRGLSVGAELEYADPETLRSALKNRS